MFTLARAHQIVSVLLILTNLYCEMYVVALVLKNYREHGSTFSAIAKRIKNGFLFRHVYIIANSEKLFQFTGNLTFCIVSSKG